MMDVPGVRKEAAAIVQRAQPTTTRWILDASADAAEHHDADAHRVAAATAAIAFVGAALLGHPASLRPRADAVERARSRDLYSSSTRGRPSPHTIQPPRGSAPSPRSRRRRAQARRRGSASTAAAARTRRTPPRRGARSARRVLVDVHDCLDVALVGVEPAGASSAARAVLLPAGSPRPPRVGAWTQRRGGGSAKGEGEEDGDGGGDGTVSLRPPADAPRRASTRDRAPARPDEDALLAVPLGGRGAGARGPDLRGGSESARRRRRRRRDRAAATDRRVSGAFYTLVPIRPRSAW